MNYDKNSFLSGMVIGRQLRGWDHAKRDILVNPWIENTPAERNDPKHGFVTWDYAPVPVSPRPGEDTVPPGDYVREYIKKLAELSGWQSLGVGPNFPYGDGNDGELFLTHTDGVTVEIFNYGYSLNIVDYINGQRVNGSSTVGRVLRYRNGYTAHVAYYSGLDWEAFQFLGPSLPGAYGTASGPLILVVTDYFRPDRKIPFIGTVGSRFGQLFEGSFNNRFVTLNSSGTGAVANVKFIRPYNAIRSSLIEVAAPINLYSGADIYDGIRGISGFVGGMNNLYNITKGSDIMDTGTVESGTIAPPISVGGVEFAGGGGTSGTAIRLS